VRCLVTGENTKFTYKGKPIKEEIFKIAQNARREFMQQSGKSISIAEAIDEVANHIKVEFQAKVKVYKTELEEEAKILEGEVENESKERDILPGN